MRLWTRRTSSNSRYTTCNMPVSRFRRTSSSPFSHDLPKGIPGSKFLCLQLAKVGAAGVCGEDFRKPLNSVKIDNLGLEALPPIRTRRWARFQMAKNFHCRTCQVIPALAPLTYCGEVVKCTQLRSCVPCRQLLLFQRP